MDICDLQYEVERYLRRCSAAEIEVVAEHIKVEEEEYQGKGKVVTLRRIQERFDGLEDEDQKIAAFKGLIEVMPARMEDDLKRLLGVMPTPIKEAAKPKSEEVPGKEDEVKDTSLLAALQALQTLGLGALAATDNSTLRREFKIQDWLMGRQKRGLITLVCVAR